jgi:hypothetical protein
LVFPTCATAPKSGRLRVEQEVGTAIVSAQCGRQLGISYVAYEGNPPNCPPISHFALMNSAGLRLALAHSTFDMPISDRAWTAIFPIEASAFLLLGLKIDQFAFYFNCRFQRVVNCQLLKKLLKMLD